MDYATIRIFGCPAYNLVDSQKRNKMESKSKKCIFIGYTAGVKGYMLWDPETRSAFVSRDVVFDEDTVMQGGSKMEDKVRGGVPDVPVDSQVEIEVFDGPESPERTVDETKV